MRIEQADIIITSHHITSHHIEETDAGRNRPLYLRNKLYDKTLKSQNYYSNILRFPVPRRSALWLYNTSWLDQYLSKRFLKQLTVSEKTTWFERGGYSQCDKLAVDRRRYCQRGSTDDGPVYRKRNIVQNTNTSKTFSNYLAADLDGVRVAE